MLSIKKCQCGGTAFTVLFDTKVHVACTKCGVLLNEDVIPTLPDAGITPMFKLSPA